MSLSRIWLFLLIIGLTLISGWFDSRGFIHAANIWKNDKLIFSELSKSALGFGVGIITYWFIVKYLVKFGVVSAELQSLLWFGVTVVGIAISSREFFAWRVTDQIVALMVLLGIGWLLVRTAS